MHQMSDFENRIFNLIKDSVTYMGFDIVKLQMLNIGTRKTLEILIERLDQNHVSIADCTTVSRQISAILDVEDIISSKYHLEVSSVGVERPLITKEDFKRFMDYTIQVKLHSAVNNNKKFKAVIKKVLTDKVELQIDKELLELEFSNIKDAKLVLTDELFKKIIKKD